MERFKKLGMLVIGIVLVTLTSMSMGYSAVTLGLAGSGADYIDNGAGNNIYAAMNAAAGASDKTLIILEGTYNFPAVYISQPGITIKAEPGKIVSITGAPHFYVQADGVTIEGLRMDTTYYAGCLRVDSNKNVSFLNNYLASTGVYGTILLWFGDVSGLVISGNVIYNYTGGNWAIGGWWNSAGTMLIDHNTFYGISGSGVQVYNYNATPTITNNIFNTTSSNIVYPATASYNAGVPTYGGPSGTGNISVPLAGLFYSTNPADAGFLYLACDAPSSVLTGSSTGGYIGALDKFYGCNDPPVAVCEVGLDEGDLLILDGSGSSDSDGTIVAYEWSIGEVVIGTTAVVGTEDIEPGIYEATLTVTDNGGKTDSCTVTLVKPLGKDPELEACLENLMAFLGITSCIGLETPDCADVQPIYVSPGILNNQDGLSRNPNALKAVLLP